jgi:hypothetical protein
MATSYVPHSHPASWHSTADWLELRLHLISVHSEQSGEIDHLDLDEDATANRRKAAESRHQASHSEAFQRAG